jgi:APA family basic amino acid/polyamine antiporter
MTEMRQDLTLTRGIAIVVGITIGTGVFLKSAPMAQAVGSPELVIAAWTVAGLVAMLGALCFAELGTLMPRAGGEYLYVRAAFGDLPGFLYVCMSFVIGAASLAAYGAAFAIFLSDIVPPPAPWVERPLELFGRPVAWQFGGRQLISIAIIAIFTLVNLAGVAFGGRVQTFLTSLKVIALLGLIAGVFLFSPGAGTDGATAALDALTHPEPMNAVTASAFGVAMLSALWAYSGWQYLPMAAAEVRDPSTTIPRAVIGGGLLVVILYLLVNSAYFYALPFNEVIASSSTAHPDAPAVGARAAQTFLGPDALSIAAVIFLISTVGSLNGILLTRARVAYAAARDGLFFQSFGRLSPGASVPASSIVVHGALAMVFAISGTFDQLTNLATVVYVLFWTLSGIALFVLRRKMANAPRPFRVPVYPFVPLMFVLIMAGILVSALIESPAETTTALLLLALGVPFYPFFRRRAQLVRRDVLH